MPSDIPQTFHWSPEIEEATLSILWHNPGRLDYFLGFCDPDVHFFEPHCKIIMDALRTVYGEKGAATWEDMVTCVREYRQLDNVGGKDALNRIYSLHPTTGLPDPKTEELRTDQILKGHIYSLKTYAEARDFTPARSMYQFIGGRGTAYPNKAKRKGLRADYTGSARIRGSIYQMHMDVAPGGQFINVRFEPPTR